MTDWLKRLAHPVAVAICLIGMWWLLKIVTAAPDYLLPHPRDVAAIILAPEQEFVRHARVTFIESALGFVGGSLAGLMMAILFQLNNSSRKILMPLAITLKTTPIVALAPLLLIWLGTGIGTKVVISSLICFFPMLVGLYEAMGQTPRGPVEYFESLRATKLETIIKLRLLYALPEAFAAMKVSATLAVVGAVVGEMVSATSGLGYVIIASSYNFQTAATFAAILLTSVCGMILYVGVASLEELFGIGRWRS